MEKYPLNHFGLTYFDANFTRGPFFAPGADDRPQEWRDMLLRLVECAEHLMTIYRGHLPSSLEDLAVRVVAWPRWSAKYWELYDSGWPRGVGANEFRVLLDDCSDLLDEESPQIVAHHAYSSRKHRVQMVCVQGMGLLDLAVGALNEARVGAVITLFAAAQQCVLKATVELLAASKTKRVALGGSATALRSAGTLSDISPHPA